MSKLKRTNNKSNIKSNIKSNDQHHVAIKETAQEVQVTHVRCCHHCQYLNTSKASAVMTCQSCRKHLAPFYFFDESSLDGLDEGGLYMSTRRLEATKILPIWGISFYWTDELIKG
jgi:hypothetical protein